ncbi:hypothetical protein ACHQM5_018915 [Ranunculus cassubicifolius]
MEGKGRTVCVTGGSGYIASWIIKLLLQRNYTVKASVRDPSDVSKTKHLHELPGASERLHLFEAHLMEQGSFDSIVEGCEGVFHVASPAILESDDPEAEIVEPAVKGTLNVLQSCAKTSSVKRVIVTSSAVAAISNTNIRTPETVVDETWYSDPEFCRKSKWWYDLSKTLAEESAWKFAKEHGIDMVTINPGVAVGPLLQQNLNGSSGFILSLINGSQTYWNATLTWADVRDVAYAHILAFEVPSASGRYFVVERVAHLSEIIKILSELYPDKQFPEKCADEKPFPPTFMFSRQKIKSLGIDFLPFEDSLKDIVESLKEKNLVSF